LLTFLALKLFFADWEAGRNVVTTLTFFDFFENWHNESFWQKTEVHLLFRPKNLPQKNYRATNFSIFHDFSIILSLIIQRVFIAETCGWVLWKGIEQNLKKNVVVVFAIKYLSNAPKHKLMQ
jgi:hypothetical protein